MDGATIAATWNNLGTTNALDWVTYAPKGIGYVPESGTPAAVGYAQESGIPYGQGLMKNAGAGLPGVSQWIAPTLNPEELDKRISELRTVQFWLEQNARMLAATIQALEVQRMTLSTLKTMNVQVADLRESLRIKLPEELAEPPAVAPAPAPAPEPDADEALAREASAKRRRRASVGGHAMKLNAPERPGFNRRPAPPSASRHPTRLASAAAPAPPRSSGAIPFPGSLYFS